MKQVIEQITMQGTHTIEIKSEEHNIDAIIKYDLIQIIDVTNDEFIINGEVVETIYALKKKHL